MTTVYLLQGLPASGKTTLARSLYPALRFNMDDMRAQLGLTHEQWNKETESVVFGAMLGAAKAAVVAGRDIVLDNTHCTPSWPRSYRKAFEPYDVTFKVHDLTDVSVDECIARDALRGDASVGEDVIRKLAGNLEKSRKNGWRLTDAWMNGAPKMPEVVPYAMVGNRPLAYICDIDGTVAINDGHRGHYEYEKVGEDAPSWSVVTTVQWLSEEYEIIFVSGRDDGCWGDTVEWLHDVAGFDLATAQRLFMRKTGDQRPDNIVKYELFNEHIRDNYDVMGVFDDRDRVVAMWRSLGLQTYQVAPGDF